ncbi:MAG: magnesium transporter [Candidatus Pacebacteria bacterium]|nr:magnesium transporter [Candidatus Paceibacterota bacterium]MDD3072319.1 magnesium transporter [Candidatus Paceibacterota bacterium]MDD3728905.1 magnesium transporter [Candidatus Paceibacterota bacterium]MDD4201478.1 magnesium transporter [Candidatus Paceibacterota bacterium]MDD5445789.1 magnesium transporter [Candidatus Paceibacterota bacterium]
MSLKQKRKSVERMVNVNVPLFFEDENLSDIRKNFLKNIKKFETINYVYIIDRQNRLKGVISIKDVLNREIDCFAKDIMEKEVVKGRRGTDRERVVSLAIKHNLKAIPVVDKNDVFLGVVTSDTILNILQEESSEDIFLAGGFLVDKSVKEIESATARKLVLFRSPWLFVGLLGGIIAARIIGAFESTISSLIALTFFIPIIVYLSDAVSTQSATIFIRRMAFSNNKNSVFNYFIRELKVGTMLGMMLGFVLSFVSYLGLNDIRIAFILLFSVFLGVLFSVFFAIMIPLLLLKMKKDPAMGTNPLATIISDILSITVYLFIAKALLYYF